MSGDRPVAAEPPRPRAEEFVIPDRAAFLRALDLSKPELGLVKERLDAGDVEAAGVGFAAHFRAKPIDTPLLPEWLPAGSDRARVIQNAEESLGGRLNDGYNVYDIPPEGIDWVDCPLFCLPRFPFFHDVINAYLATHDSRYARFVIDISLEYMQAYPIEWFAGKHGNEGYRNHYLVGPPTWWCLCPERLHKWARALAVLRHCVDVTDEELLTILHRMLEETRHELTQIPFWVARRHNAGGHKIRVLGTLAAVLDDFTESREWLRRDAEWLADYLDHAFYPDGLCKELTLCYSGSIVAQQCRISYVFRDQPAVIARQQRLRDMIEAMVGVAMPSGEVPSYGDGMARKIEDVLYAPLLEWLGMSAPGAGSRSPPNRLPSRSRLPSGTSDLRSARDMSGPVRQTGATCLPSEGVGPVLWPPPGTDAWGGYYAMRSDGSPDARYLVIDGGPWGTTHQHMDKLSFVLCAHGADFITDPGNTLYASNEPDARISMLNAGFLHNTITVDGVDEYGRDMSELDTDRPLGNRWEQGDGWVLFEGSYDFAPEKPVRWTRRVLFVDSRYWFLQDVLVGEPETVEVEQNFQFERDIEVSVDGSDVMATAPNGARLALRCHGRIVPHDRT